MARSPSFWSRAITASRSSMRSELSASHSRRGSSCAPAVPARRTAIRTPRANILNSPAIPLGAPRLDRLPDLRQFARDRVIDAGRRRLGFLLLADPFAERFAKGELHRVFLAIRKVRSQRRHLVRIGELAERRQVLARRAHEKNFRADLDQENLLPLAERLPRQDADDAAARQESRTATEALEEDEEARHQDNHHQRTDQKPAQRVDRLRSIDELLRYGARLRERLDFFQRRQHLEGFRVLNRCGRRNFRKRRTDDGVLQYGCDKRESERHHSSPFSTGPAKL